MKDLLESFMAIDGVHAAILVGRDGLLIESVARDGEEIDVEAVAAVASTGLGASEVLGREINLGRPVQTFAEYEKGVVVLEPVADLAALAIVADGVSHLGRIRLVARRQRRDLEQAVTA